MDGTCAKVRRILVMPFLDLPLVIHVSYVVDLPLVTHLLYLYQLFYTNTPHANNLLTLIPHSSNHPSYPTPSLSPTPSQFPLNPLNSPYREVLWDLPSEAFVPGVTADDLDSATKRLAGTSGKAGSASESIANSKSNTHRTEEKDEEDRKTFLGPAAVTVAREEVIHTRTCIHTHIYTHAYTHIHTRTHIYTHIHTRTHIFSLYVLLISDTHPFMDEFNGRDTSIHSIFCSNEISSTYTLPPAYLIALHHPMAFLLGPII